VSKGNCRRISDGDWNSLLEIENGAGYTNATCEAACTKNPLCVAFDFCTGTKACVSCNGYKNDTHSAYQGDGAGLVTACHIKNTATIYDS